MNDLRAVVFDLGNTLWFYRGDEPGMELYAREADRVRPLLAQWSIEAPPDLPVLMREIWAAFEAASAYEAERGQCIEPSLPLIIEGALASRDIAISPAQADLWWDAAWLPVYQFGVQLYPDTLDVLAAVKRIGLLVGINSTRPCTGAMLARDLPHFGMTEYVDAMVCSGDTGFVKPHPSTFTRVLGELNVSPEEAVMVGDSPAADMAGAKALGMRTVLKLNGRYDLPPCPDADYAIHDLAELLTLPLFGAAASPPRAESLTPHDDRNEDRY